MNHDANFASSRRPPVQPCSFQGFFQGTHCIGGSASSLIREGEAPAEPRRRKLGGSLALPKVPKRLSIFRKENGNQKLPICVGPRRVGPCISLVVRRRLWKSRLDFF